MPGGSWAPVASQPAAQGMAVMGAARGAYAQRARARVKRPARAVDSRMERVARTAELAGQQR
eukprot:12966561-Alexandrium_andersonii.AAC.1